MTETAPEIVIFEPDEISRRVIGAAIQAENLEGVRFTDNVAVKEGAAFIYICLPGAGPPDHLQLSEGDIFVKPLRMGTLLDRISRYRRSYKAGAQDRFIKIGSYDLDVGNNLLGDIRLTEKETAILKYLHEHKSRKVTREELLDAVWGYAQGVETHTLETHIYRLRQKIEKDAAAPRILLTEENGYRLAR